MKKVSRIGTFDLKFDFQTHAIFSVLERSKIPLATFCKANRYVTVNVDNWLFYRITGYSIE